MFAPLATLTAATSLLVVLSVSSPAGAVVSEPPFDAAPGSLTGGDQTGARADQPAGLNVPYLPQTEALCGGAAAAMVLRYWGDRHAGVAQFAPLVDRRAGGIATDALARSLTDRGWEISVVQGTIGLLRRELAAAHPLILLLEDRPQRYHYLVAVAADDTHVWLHDPTWGPARAYSVSELVGRWGASNFWALLVLPGTRSFDRVLPPEEPVPRPTSDRAERTVCRQALDEALDEIATRGLGAADEVLSAVRLRCPEDSAPVSELAGVRVAQKRFEEATSLASEAVRLDPRDGYAWDVLGSSHFLQNNPQQALRAWNHIGKPRLDSVQLAGVNRTRYALAAGMLPIAPESLLTPEGYERSRRRLELLPDRVSSQISFRPDAEGFATVDAAVAERPRWPTGPIGWGITGGRALINREVHEAVPGWTGQGEVWDVQGRWWDNRPRGGLAFVAPRSGWWPGIWHVDGFVETQTYLVGGALARERRAHAGAGVTDWISSQLRYQVTAGADWWEGRETVSFGGSLDRRVLGDRISLSGVFQNWVSLENLAGFRTAEGSLLFRSSPTAAPFVLLAGAHVEAVSTAAPLALWAGAGDGHGRETLLRAHPLLHDGIIDGSVFGRQLTRIGLEAQRWLERPAIAPIGLALFVDAARANRTLNGTGPTPTHVDIGGGIRLRAPGRELTVRLDYAHGLRDGRHAITLGWTGAAELPPRH